MWTLLGDPALRLPLIRSDRRLSLQSKPVAGSVLAVKIDEIRRPTGSQVTVVAEILDSGAKSQPAFGTEISCVTVHSNGTAAEAQLPRPKRLPRNLLIHATASHQKQTQIGVRSID